MFFDWRAEQSPGGPGAAGGRAQWERLPPSFPSAQHCHFEMGQHPGGQGARGSAQTDAGVAQAALSNERLVTGGPFLCDKLTFIPVE